MDDTAFWALLTSLGSFALTTSSQVEYHRPIFANSKVLTVASVTEVKDGKTVTISVKMLQKDQLCTTGTFNFALISLAKMEKIVNYKFPPHFEEQLARMTKIPSKL